MTLILKFKVFLLRNTLHTRTGRRTISLTQSGTSSIASEEKYRSGCAEGRMGEILAYADLQNTKLFYSSLREVYGLPQRCAAPIRNLQGEVLTDNEAIHKRWADYFKQLLNKSSSFDPYVTEEILLTSLHLELVDSPTENEQRESMDQLQSCKPAGPEDIPPEVCKAGGQMLIQKFTEFLCTCWEDGCLSQDLNDAKAVRLYKGK